jgi:hypothetical protein
LAAPEKFRGMAEADRFPRSTKWLTPRLRMPSAPQYEIARQTFAYTGDYAKQLSTDPIEGFAFLKRQWNSLGDSVR